MTQLHERLQIEKALKKFMNEKAKSCEWNSAKKMK